MKRMIAIVAAGLASLAQAQAAAIVVNQWYTFGFGGQGSPLVSGVGGFTLGTNPASIAAPAAPWTFTLGAGGGTLVVTDGFDSGDQFQFSNFGTVLGTTSAAATGSNCGSDITACLANASISKGTFALAAGAYSLSGIATASPFGGGAGFFIVRQATPAVPEPATWALMLLGFGTLGVALRRHKGRGLEPKVSFV